MTETQLLLYPSFKTLPIYDESDERSHSILTGVEGVKQIKECTQLQEVEECLKNPKLVPLGAIRVGHDGIKAVVVYFGEMA